MPGADFPLPGAVGAGWGRAGLWETGWVMYSPRASPLLSQRIHGPSFLFLVANQEQFSQPSFPNSLWPSASFPACSASSEDLKCCSGSDPSRSCRGARGGLCSRGIPVQPHPGSAVCGIPQGATKKRSLQAGATDLTRQQHQQKLGSPAAKSLVLVQLPSSLQLRRRGRKFPSAGDFLWLLSEAACRGPSSEPG